jgi:hypothetical protein
VAGVAHQLVTWTRDREWFTGWIAGVGTTSGYRIVIGHWDRSPYGVVTDAMVEDPTGHRTLYAPTPQLAEFLAAAYRFDEVRVAPCRARRSSPGWTVEAGSLQVSFATGRRPPLGWLLWVMPTPLTRMPWWVGLLDVAARRVLPGFVPGAAPAMDVASGTAPGTFTPSSPLTPLSTAVISAGCERSTRRSASALARCRAGRPWSTSPPSSRLSTLDMAATRHERRPLRLAGSSCFS